MPTRYKLPTVKVHVLQLNTSRYTHLRGMEKICATTAPFEAKEPQEIQVAMVAAKDKKKWQEYSFASTLGAGPEKGLSGSGGETRVHLSWH